MREFLNIWLGRVLTQGTKTFANLLLLNFSITSIVKKVKGFLIFYEKEEKMNFKATYVFSQKKYPQQKKMNAFSADDQTF